MGPQHGLSSHSPFALRISVTRPGPSSTAPSPSNAKLPSDPALSRIGVSAGPMSFAAVQSSPGRRDALRSITTPWAAPTHTATTSPFGAAATRTSSP